MKYAVVLPKLQREESIREVDFVSRKVCLTLSPKTTQRK